MKRVLLITGVALLLSVAVTQGQGQIAGGRHDFSMGSALRNTNTAINAQTCVFCHTPHGGSFPNPLWNRANTTSTYLMYTSSTLDTAAPTSASISSSVSGTCMSCHDGSIAIDVLTTVGGVAPFTGATLVVQAGARGTYTVVAPATRLTGGFPFLGVELRNDHPINIIYETARAAQAPSEFATQAITGSRITVGATGPLPLFGTTTATATVECASCHNAHNNTNTNFLRKSNAGSAICLTCHIK